MHEQSQHPCESLLREWQVTREVANYYFTALLRLAPEAPDAQKRRQELNGKLFLAQAHRKHVEDQLQSCCKEHGEIGMSH
jgi:hypothetical protein